MSLATRCTACGTIFRIVEDQLRVSDGWVRCGRCSEVFDARELLFDIERDTPPPWPAPFTPEPAPEVAPPPPLPPPPPPPPPPPAPVPPATFDTPDWPPEAPLPQMPEPEIAAPPTDWGMHSSDRREPRWVDDDPAPEPAVPPPPPAAPPAPLRARVGGESLPAEPSERTAEPAVPVPEFMRQARQNERWRKPGMVAALAAGALVLGLLLLLQIALHYRNVLAASHPALRGTLAGLCRPLGCDIQPWRRIDALSIDSTSLNPLGSNNSYKLNLALRNKTSVDVAAPWIELSLTDAGGAPFARRVLGPDSLTPALKQVNAESEQTLSLVFSTGTQRVSGYSVNIFYP